MKLRQVEVKIHTDKGTARVVLSGAGKVISGNKDMLKLVEGLFGGSGAPARAESNTVIDAQPPENKIWRKDP